MPSQVTYQVTCDHTELMDLVRELGAIVERIGGRRKLPKDVADLCLALIESPFQFVRFEQTTTPRAREICFTFHPADRLLELATALRALDR